MNRPNQQPQQEELAADFLEFSREELVEQYWPRLRTCIESLTDEQVWWRPNDASNRVGNLLLHLNGNVRQWLISSFNHWKTCATGRRNFLSDA
jgi:hypothetical protein